VDRGARARREGGCHLSRPKRSTERRENDILNDPA